MALEFSTLKNKRIHATDGDIGQFKDLLFDDRQFYVRYLVVDTSVWLPGRKVLIAPRSVKKIDEDTIAIDLTVEQIKNSPAASSDLPVSRQYEAQLHAHYGWIPYWTAPPHEHTWFPYPAQRIPPAGTDPSLPEEWQEMSASRRKQFDEHLRSAEELCGYRIDTKDEKTFGEVNDLIFDVDHWYLIDLILASRKWLPGGKQFTCSPLFIDEIDAVKRHLHIHMTKDVLINSPEYSRRDYGEESRLAMVEHYLGRPQSASVPHG